MNILILSHVRCAILDLLQSIEHGLCTPHQLQQAVDDFVAAFVQAGWKHRAKKKIHWLQHFAKELAQFGFLPNCWSTERKNKVLKLLGCNVQNTTVFDQTVLQETLARDLHRLKQPGLFDTAAKLDPPRKISKKSLQLLRTAYGDSACPPAECFQSSRARLSNSSVCCSGDAVLMKSSSRKWDAAEVLMFVSIRAEPMALVREWSLESCRQDWSRATWKMLESIVFVPLEDLLSPVAFSHCRDSRAITLIPRWHS